MPYGALLKATKQKRVINMKNLKAALNHKASITVPSTKGLSGLAPEELTERTVEMVQSDFSLMFGGSTSYKAVGTYKSDSGELVKEEVTVVTANIAELDDDAELLLVTLAELVKVRHEQECVALEVDGKMYFV